MVYNVLCVHMLISLVRQARNIRLPSFPAAHCFCTEQYMIGRKKHASMCMKEQQRGGEVPEASGYVELSVTEEHVRGQMGWHVGE